MTRNDHRTKKVRHFSAVVAALALAAALTGCVVYPDGPGYGYYGHPHYYWHHDRD